MLLNTTQNNFFEVYSGFMACGITCNFAELKFLNSNVSLARICNFFRMKLVFF